MRVLHLTDSRNARIGSGVFIPPVQVGPQDGVNGWSTQVRHAQNTRRAQPGDEDAGPAPAAPPLGATAMASATLRPVDALPDWVPEAVRTYLDHTAGGQSLREIARRQGVHASTVLRQVRRFESRRDDPLIDRAIDRALGRAEDASAPVATAAPPDQSGLMAQARRLLPLLAQPGAVLAAAADMDRAVVLRDGEGEQERLAVLDRSVAEAFALRDWITCARPGRVARYTLSPEGRAMLRKLGADVPRPRPAAAREGDEDGRFRPHPESPVSVLARRRDGDGRAFLTPRQVAAADRLHEDFVVAGLGPGDTPDAPPPSARPAPAFGRLRAALDDLGPGLADVALRCVCWQEGVETAEHKLGWSARSGKIVLRIALDRLVLHYADLGEAGMLIG